MVPGYGKKSDLIQAKKKAPTRSPKLILLVPIPRSVSSGTLTPHPFADKERLGGSSRDALTLVSRRYRQQI